MAHTSRLAHYALYALPVAVPVVGIAVQFARGEPLPLLGFIEVASPWTADRPLTRSMKEMHEVLAHALRSSPRCMPPLRSSTIGCCTTARLRACSQAVGVDRIMVS